MKRRTFLAGSGLAGPAMAFLADAEAPAEAPATRWEKSAQRKREITQGIVWPNHEDLAFLLRRGGNPEDVVEHYEAQHDPANIPRMAAAGIRYARIHFYKGLGLQAEGPEIERTRRSWSAVQKPGGSCGALMLGCSPQTAQSTRRLQASSWKRISSAS